MSHLLTRRNRRQHRVVMRMLSFQEASKDPACTWLASSEVQVFNSLWVNGGDMG
jgi:hypothetical protein